MSLPQMIGLSGFAQVGKDTVAEILIADYGYQAISPSDVLRDFLYAQNAYLPHREVLRDLLRNGLRDWRAGQRPPLNLARRVQDVVDARGWEEARRRYPHIRELQQRTGTEAGRGILGENIWIDTLIAGLDPAGRYVSTSVRFPNEAAPIVARGGPIIRITRPGVAPANGHESDTSMNGWDFEATITNDGTLDDLRRKVADTLAGLDIQGARTARDSGDSGERLAA